MENATKALLIAAAVLVVIVIIALGVALLNAGDNPTDQAKSVAESTSVQSFNGQFESYLGTHKSASTVRSLIVAIKASNKYNASHTITEPTITVTEGKTYKVEVPATGGYDDDGRIKVINVTQE